MQLPFLLAAAPEWASVWLTPIWLLGVGALIALAILAAIWLVVFIIRRSTGQLLFRMVVEGPLMPIFVVTCLLAGFGIVGATVVHKPAEILDSLARLAQTGEGQPLVFEIEPGNSDPNLDITQIEPQKIDVAFDDRELVEMRLKCDVNATVSAYAALPTDTEPRFELSGGETYVWNRQAKGGSPFPSHEVDALYVWNSDVRPTTLRVTLVTAPIHREVQSIPLTAAIILGVFLLYFLPQISLPRAVLNALPARLQAAVQPKIGAVALATAKSVMAQPLFLFCMALGFFFLTMFVVLPYNTFGEDIKMMKDAGLTLIMVLAIITCLWAAGNSISEEIEGRTALTVLSKPVGRWQFILGKFVGISWVAAVMFLLLGLWFLIAIAYKPIYDARETANAAPDWQQCNLEMIKTAPGLALGFFETLVLAAISVAISTRLPMLANFIICVSVYTLGHLTPLLVKSSYGSLELVLFVARLFATVLPVLEHFDIKPAIAGGVDVPLDYLGWSLLYCVLYSTVAMLLALTMFEDRDLA